MIESYVSFPKRPCERCDHVEELFQVAGSWMCRRCAERIERAARLSRLEELVRSGKR